jgi:hypothetical protein
MANRLSPQLLTPTDRQGPVEHLRRLVVDRVLAGSADGFFFLVAVLQPLKAVAATLNALGFRYFLVGATARAIILENVFGRAPGGLTRDLDFGVAPSDWEQFEALRAVFVRTGKFELTSALQRILYLYSPGLKIKVDLIPFGGIQDGASSISWPPKEKRLRPVLERSRRGRKPDLVARGHQRDFLFVKWQSRYRYVVLNRLRQM